MTERDGRPAATVGTRTAEPGETAGRQQQPSFHPSGNSKQRRSGRLTVAIPILIIGSDGEGRVFSEETHTVVVSLHGAGIVSRHKLMAEQELILRAVEPNREAEVRVVGEIGQQGKIYTYGVAFVAAQLDFWKMELPAAPAWSERPVALALECGGCKGMVELTDGDFEYDICAIRGGLARFCDECGLLTVWRQSHEVMPAAREKKPGSEVSLVPEGGESPVAVAEVEEKAEEFVALADAMEGTERRSRVRAKVNFFACVRTETFGEDIVMCIDMSRGGVSFRSKHAYQKEMGVSIAVPFSPEAKEAPAIFVKGRIANVKEMGGGLWRCGVEFLR
jgi:PilZ domain-containing protein